MALPNDYTVEKQRETEWKPARGTITDMFVNTDPKKHNGEFKKDEHLNKYININVTVIDGERSGEKFTHENLHVGVYISKSGKKSPFYMLLQMVGLSKDKIFDISKGTIENFNPNALIGKEFRGVKWTREGKCYIDARDPDFITKKGKPTNNNDLNLDSDNTEVTAKVEEALGEEKDLFDF